MTYRRQWMHSANYCAAVPKEADYGMVLARRLLRLGVERPAKLATGALTGARFLVSALLNTPARSVLDREAAMTQPHTLEGRAVDWPAAVVSGFGAGAILMVLDLFWSIAVIGSGPWAAPRMIAAIVMGPEVLQSPGFRLDVITVALIAHYAFGIVGGLVLAAISARLRLDANLGLAVLTGAALGLVLYFVNFYAVASVFPWFAEVRGWSTLLINLIFGISAAALYWRLARRGDAHQSLREAP